MVSSLRPRNICRAVALSACLLVPLAISACGDDDDGAPVAIGPRVPPPAATTRVTTFAPRFGVVGTNQPLVIQGENFNNVTGVIFSVDQAVEAGNFTVDSPTQITVTQIPENVAAGVITVATPTESAASPFEYTPTIFGGESPDLALIIDVSGSSSGSFGGSPVGDLNGDGNNDTILDAEIAAYITLNRELIRLGLGDIADVSIVPFSSDASVLDLDATQDGIQEFAKPNQDNNNNNIPDLEEAFLTLVSDGSTNYEDALRVARETLLLRADFADPAEARLNRNVIFLSDGEPTAGDQDNGYGGQVNLLIGDPNQPDTRLVDNLRAFGVGTGATLPTLQVIDPSAQIFTTSDELLFVIQGGQLQN